MIDIKIVIGANFGDEGKGLVTDYLSNRFVSQNKACLNVLSNGGPQRAHTVNLSTGQSHTFKHLGSGTLVGADTYFPSHFLINPMEYRREMLEIAPILRFKPKVYTNPYCVFTTPWDTIVNQIIEESRGDKKHGSCGMGIWETICRAENEHLVMGIQDFNKLSNDVKIQFLKNIRDNYFLGRLKLNDIARVPDNWERIYFSENLITNFIDDVRYFCDTTTPTTDDVLTSYERIVFENGQGLLLDERLGEFYGNNLTPSKTGSDNTFSIIKKVFKNRTDYKIELCYVTRPYLTRHGAGRFETECKMETIGNIKIADETNVTNTFQGKLRYGELIVGNLINRVYADANKFEILPIDCKNSIFVTHTNEAEIDLERLKSSIYIDCVYASNTKFRESVKKI